MLPPGRRPATPNGDSINDKQRRPRSLGNTPGARASDGQNKPRGRGRSGNPRIMRLAHGAAPTIGGQRPRPQRRKSTFGCGLAANQGTRSTRPPRDGGNRRNGARPAGWRSGDVWCGPASLRRRRRRNARPLHAAAGATGGAAVERASLRARIHAVRRPSRRALRRPGARPEATADRVGRSGGVIKVACPSRRRTPDVAHDPVESAMPRPRRTARPAMPIRDPDAKSRGVPRTGTCALPLAPRAGRTAFAADGAPFATRTLARRRARWGPPGRAETRRQTVRDDRSRK